MACYGSSETHLWLWRFVIGPLLRENSDLYVLHTRFAIFLVSVYIVVTRAMAAVGVSQEHFGMSLFSTMICLFEVTGSHKNIFEFKVHLLFIGIMFLFCAMIKKPKQEKRTGLVEV